MAGTADITDVRSPQAFARDILASLSEGQGPAAVGPLTRFDPTVVVARYLGWYNKVLMGSNT